METLFKGPRIIYVRSAWKPSTEFQSSPLFCESPIGGDEPPDNKNDVMCASRKESVSKLTISLSRGSKGL